MGIKNKILIVCIFLEVLIILFLGFIIVGKIYYSDVRLIEREYNVELPSDMELKYKESNIGWFGEGERYLVYKLNSEPSIILNFSKTKDLSMENSVNQILSTQNIPKNYLPNWYESYYFLNLEKHGNLYMIYFPKVKKLLIIEERY